MKKKDAVKMIRIVFIVFFLLNSTSVGAQKVVIKIATLAPEGSAWMQVFNQLNADVKAKTQNGVRFRVYSGGVLGDEMDMIRKMHIGQIHGAVLSAPGLSTIYQEIDVFQIPFLFETYEEVDHILKKMEAFFRKGLDKKGYNLLGWSEGGFIHMMSTVPISTLGELKNVKVWTWEEAPIAKAIFDEAKISAIPLTIPDVLMGLQTGLVEVVYAPPAGAISLQWFTRVKYLNDTPLSYLAGAIVVKKSVFKKIPPSSQKIIMDSFKDYTVKIKQVVREQNQDAVRVMKKHGITVLRPPRQEVEKFKMLSKKAMKRIEGKHLAPQVLAVLNDYLEQYRKDTHQ